MILKIGRHTFITKGLKVRKITERHENDRLCLIYNGNEDSFKAPKDYQLFISFDKITCYIEDLNIVLTYVVTETDLVFKEAIKLNFDTLQFYDVSKFYKTVTISEEATNKRIAKIYGDNLLKNFNVSPQQVVKKDDIYYIILKITDEDISCLTLNSLSSETILFKPDTVFETIINDHEEVEKYIVNDTFLSRYVFDKDDIFYKVLIEDKIKCRFPFAIKLI